MQPAKAEAVRRPRPAQPSRVRVMHHVCATPCVLCTTCLFHQEACAAPSCTPAHLHGAAAAVSPRCSPWSTLAAHALQKKGKLSTVREPSYDTPYMRCYGPVRKLAHAQEGVSLARLGPRRTYCRCGSGNSISILVRHNRTTTSVLCGRHTHPRSRIDSYFGLIRRAWCASQRWGVCGQGGRGRGRLRTGDG